MVSGLNLLSARSPLRGVQSVLRIGDHAAFELTGPCDPCSKMERELGTGAYNALRGHGGVTARVIADGRIALFERLLPPTAVRQIGRGYEFSRASH